jgi:hypothetical protein
LSLVQRVLVARHADFLQGVDQVGARELAKRAQAVFERLGFDDPLDAFIAQAFLLALQFALFFPPEVDNPCGTGDENVKKQDAQRKVELLDELRKGQINRVACELFGKEGKNPEEGGNDTGHYLVEPELLTHLLGNFLTRLALLVLQLARLFEISVLVAGIGEGAHERFGELARDDQRLLIVGGRAGQETVIDELDSRLDAMKFRLVALGPEAAFVGVGMHTLELSPQDTADLAKVSRRRGQIELAFDVFDGLPIVLHRHSRSLGTIKSKIQPGFCQGSSLSDSCKTGLSIFS